MAISFDKYIDIVSAVGGAAAALTRELIGRLFTTNRFVPAGGTLTFTTADEVKFYFGVDSEEYKRAAWYFRFVGKQVTRPKKISFSRWNSVNQAAKIFGGKSASLATFQNLAAADFYLTIGDTTNFINGLDFTAAASMANVATIIQAKINSFVNPNFEDATVAYNATTGGFDLTAGVVVTTPAVAYQVETAIGTVEPDFLGSVLRWAIVEPQLYFSVNDARADIGVAAENPEETFIESANSDNNFGSFLFMAALTDEQIGSIAAANDARNVDFLYTVPVLVSDFAAIVEAIGTAGGNCLTLLNGDVVTPPADQYPEMMPMVILAATDYNRVDAAQNYMYQMADLTPVVTSSLVSDGADGYRVNYYGATQQAGRLLAFYQRGYMNGQNTDPLDMNTYVNEIWLKDNIGVELINLQLSLGKISANRQGRATVISGVQVAVSRALFNGVISVGKILTGTQKAYITSVTGQTDAWRQVQNVGYWLDCFIEPFTGPGGSTEYKARYVLIYAKDDVVRLIEGSDILI